MGALATQTRTRSTLSKVAWNPEGELSLAGWLAQGQKLGHMGRSAGWWIGDWLRYGNAAYGERYVRAARATGYDVQTLMNMVYVASRFPASRRRENLSWSHHEALAALEPEEQDMWLDQASLIGGQCLTFAPCGGAPVTDAYRTLDTRPPPLPPRPPSSSVRAAGVVLNREQTMAGRPSLRTGVDERRRVSVARGGETPT